MVTKEQAMTCREFHYTGGGMCSCIIGKRGGKTCRIVRVRASGKCQTWKRDPARFRLPVKYGLYESNVITQDNAQYWHAEADCPLNKDTAEEK